jgi:hypothetical protein
MEELQSYKFCLYLKMAGCACYTIQLYSNFSIMVLGFSLKSTYMSYCFASAFVLELSYLTAASL